MNEALMRRLTIAAGIIVLVAVIMVVGDLLTASPTAVTPVIVVPTETVRAADTPCPQATPELFQVEPITSPTDQLSQIITVTLGLGRLITVSSEAGTVAGSAGFPTLIEIPLLPETTHHLIVSGTVQTVQQGDCTYGGYLLTTTRDRYGDPLVIEQRRQP